MEDVAPTINKSRQQQHCSDTVIRKRSLRGRKEALWDKTREDGRRLVPRRSFFPAVPRLGAPRFDTRVVEGYREDLHGKELPRVAPPAMVGFIGDGSPPADANRLAMSAPHDGVFDGPGKTTSWVPPILRDNPRPAAGEFDSRDMIMVARLLAHPESSLKVRGGRLNTGT